MSSSRCSPSLLAADPIHPPRLQVKPTPLSERKPHKSRKRRRVADTNGDTDGAAGNDWTTSATGSDSGSGSDSDSDSVSDTDPEDTDRQYETIYAVAGTESGVTVKTSYKAAAAPEAVSSDDMPHMPGTPTTSFTSDVTSGPRASAWPCAATTGLVLGIAGEGQRRLDSTPSAQSFSSSASTMAPRPAQRPRLALCTVDDNVDKREHGDGHHDIWIHVAASSGPSSA